MRLFILPMLLLLLLATPAIAAQITKQINVEWEYPVTAETTIAGFRLYNQEGVVVLDNIPPQLRTAAGSYTFDDAAPQAFHLVAYGPDNQQTAPSNIVIVAPKYKPLTGVGKITIELSDLKPQ